jgi:Ice-binding-like/Bacterial Ig-like domain
MRKLVASKVWIGVLLLAVLVAGCGDWDKNARNPGDPLTPPTVTSVTPPDGSTVSNNAVITATFSKAMNPATINTSTFTLSSGGARVPGQVTYVAATKIATFQPAASLAPGTTFTATIATGANDAFGNALAASFVWSFATGAPSVISTTPANGANAVPVNTLVSATFREAMNPATIDAATFTLTGPGATPVAGVVTYAGTKATFSASGVLANSTLYTATVTTGAKDLTGVPLAANFVWTFTTAGPPTVVSTVPANGAGSVAVNTTISATFSEAMNAATINAATFTVTGPGATPVAGAVTYAGTTATFTPTVALATSILYTATITTGAKDLTGAPLAANFVRTFTTAAPPTVVSTVPANGAGSVAVNTTISATFSEAMNAATINAASFTVTGPGATPVAGAVTFAGTTATFTPTAALANGTLFTATITTGAKNAAGAALATNFAWTFTTTSTPTVTSTVPNNGASNVPLNQKITATFSGAMTASTITAVGTFTLAVAGGGAAVAGTVTYDAVSNTATFAPIAGLAANTQYMATVTTAAQSAQGAALAANVVWTFTTVPPPSVVSTVPVNGAAAVAVNTTISATFSKAMNAATINAATFTLTGPGATPVAGVVTYAGTTATFTPAAILANSTLFTATITTGAKDPAGAPLAANFVWTFTTAPPPSVISAVPVNGASAVAVNSTISATFSEAMNPTTINAATFTVTGPGATPVAGAVTYAGVTATFTPTVALATSILYTATITTGAKDPTGAPLAANFVRTFTTAGPPTVVSTVPVNGATAVGVNTTISATFSEAMNATTINAGTFTVTGPGATPVAGVVTYAGVIATFTPAVALVSSTLYTATITTGAKNPAGAALAANFVWTLTTAAPPTVVSTIPVNGATAVAVNTAISATFGAAMNPATITAATFTLTGPGATPVAGAVTYAGNTATFTPTGVLANSTVFTATITTGAKDPTGAPLATNFVWTFITAPAPTVVSTVPANGGTAVPVNTLVSATFSEAMNAATINAATFSVTGPGATPVAGVVTYAGVTATFTPTGVLANSTVFTATITTGAKDPTGAPLATNFVWTFTTAPAPTVVSTVPANGATAVPVNTVVSATFSETMNAATINAASFTVTGPGATPAAGVVTYAGNTATFTPTAVFANNTLFTATITTGAKDPAGVPLAANFVWTFTTAPPPTVVSTVPANGAGNVAESTTVTATFNVPMDATTINATTFTLMGPGATPATGSVNYAGNTATFTPGVLLAASTLYTATITTGAKDATGAALAANFVWTFTTASTPTVTFTVPASGASNVPLNQKITATFSIPMSAATITAAGTFTVAVAGGGAAVAGTVTYDTPSNTATFAPTAALAASTQYTATVTTAAQSTQGNALAANYIWSFTTGVAANASAPFVTSTDPASAAINVPLNQKIAATFSTFMDPATITATGTFTVAVAGGGSAIPGTVSYANSTAVFTPTANLAASTQYTATITTAAKDLTGVAVAANFVWSFTSGLTVDAVAPTITSTNPTSAAVNVPIDKRVNATFSKPMDPTTITNATFTLEVAGGGAPVNGTVAYDPGSQIATFTPSGSLASNTQYTAMISNLVRDLTGNSLAAGAAPNPWSFTTSGVVGTGPATINLGAAGSFAVMAAATITSTGLTSINGDVGLRPGTAEGIPAGEVNGTIHINDPVVTKAQADLLAAYNDAVSRTINAQALPANIGGLTFAPGLYVNATSVMLSGAGSNNNVTLDAQGDPNAVFLFKMGSTLTTAPASQVILAGGAKASNIFWQVGSSATIDTTTIFKGNVLAAVSITLNTGAVVEGRMFAGSDGTASGAVTLDTNTITVPAP